MLFLASGHEAAPNLPSSPADHTICVPHSSTSRSDEDVNAGDPYDGAGEGDGIGNGHGDGPGGGDGGGMGG